jgi:hypothetical protein
MSDVPQLISLRTTVACLVIAPSCEVAEALLSPLKGTSTGADLAAVHAHQGVFVASVLIGLLGTVLYLPAYLGLAARTASRSPRLAVAGGLLCGFGMVAFGGVRMVSALELQTVREPWGPAAAGRAIDALGSSPVMGAVLAAFLLGLAIGYPLLAVSCWRAGLPRAAATWWAVMPFVAFFVDDNHWGNLATHTLLLGSLVWIARALMTAGLPSRALLRTRTVAGAMVLAPLLEVVEQVVSPLTTTSTRADVVASTDHRAAFAVAVLVGTAATVLYVPALVGLAARCVPDSPVAARIGAAAAVVSMTGFMGVRAVQAFEPQAVGAGQTPTTTARLVDHLSANPIGGVVLVMFLGGSMVGLVALAVAAWRNGLPRPAVVLLGLFPFLDLAVPGRTGTLVTHLRLLLALTWLALSLARTDRSGSPASLPRVAQTA